MVGEVSYFLLLYSKNSFFWMGCSPSIFEICQKKKVTARKSIIQILQILLFEFLRSITCDMLLSHILLLVFLFPQKFLVSFKTTSVWTHYSTLTCYKQFLQHYAFAITTPVNTSILQLNSNNFHSLARARAHRLIN